MSICPGGAPHNHNQCPAPNICRQRHLCMMLREPPIDTLDRDYQIALHFVGFRGEEYHSATRVWGLPDFIHRGWDRRAQREIAPGDIIVFGPKADPSYVSP